MNYKHGLTYHPLYRIWQDMKRRCYDINRPRFKDWGGRGIIVCSEWKDNPKAFIDWSENNGYQC
jgi:hypothetical protein